MPPLVRTAIAALPLLLSACAAGERGLVSPHQPLVSAAGAAVPGCPDWHDRNWSPSEGQSTNYGCATATNLAAMIADPADLLHGKVNTGAGSADVAVRAIKAQRESVASGKGGQVTQVSSKAAN